MTDAADGPRGGMTVGWEGAAAARHAGQAAQDTVAITTPAIPSPSTSQSARTPGCGSAMAASPTGNSGDAASASTAASTAPAAPISAARVSPAAVSWAGLIPTALNAP